MKHPDNRHFQPFRIECDGNPATAALPELLDQVHALGKVFFCVDDVCTIETHPLVVEEPLYVACHFPHACEWTPAGSAAGSANVGEVAEKKKAKKEK